MKRKVCVAILAGLSLAAVATAQEYKVHVALDSDRVGRMSYEVLVKGPAAYVLMSPTQTELRPYVIDAQKALAEREGYSVKIFGNENYRMLSGVRVLEIRITDAATGRLNYTSRPPLESEAAPPPERERSRPPPDRTPEDQGFAPSHGKRGARAPRISR